MADCSAIQLDNGITIRASDWLKGEASFDQWKEGVASRKSELSELSKEEVRKHRLMEKYARIWRMKSVRGEHHCVGIEWLVATNVSLVASVLS